MNLTKHIHFIKHYLDEAIQKMSSCADPKISQQLFERHSGLKQLISDLEEAEKKIKSYDSPAQISDYSSALSPEILNGLPPELVQQLSISEGDREEFKLIELIKKKGNTISLDHLLIAWYHEYQQVLERSTTNSRIYRMIKKGFLYSVPGKKGIYSVYLSEKNNRQSKKD